MPKISIVTPCYNSESFLEETILSVLDQNYPNLQYIIIDGASHDRSISIIKKYEHYIDYWFSEPDLGQSDAICKGLKLCNGDVFNWLNADDTYMPNALAIIGEHFKDPSVHVVAAKSRIYGMGTDIISTGTDIYTDNLERTIGRARIDQPETFFRLSRIKKIGGPNMHFHYLMDRELWIRYLYEYGISGIKQINNIIVNFRLHDQSKSVSQKEGFMIEDEMLFNVMQLYMSSEPAGWSTSWRITKLEPWPNPLIPPRWPQLSAGCWRIPIADGGSEPLHDSARRGSGTQLGWLVCMRRFTKLREICQLASFTLIRLQRNCLERNRRAAMRLSPEHIVPQNLPDI